MINSIWICILGFIVSFMDGFGMGANDVSHSFATSVGSGTLTMMQACTIALFTEFLGAALLGNNNAKTISGLVIASEFNETPILLMLIMTCALLGSSLWTISSVRLSLPVSSTHAISGAIVGGVLLNYGFDHINWSFSSGVSKIAISWVTSPIISGVFAASLFLFTRTFVLRRSDSYNRGKLVIPFYFSITIFIDVFLVISKTHFSHDFSNGKIFVISLLSGILSFVFFKYFLVPFIVRKIDNPDELLYWYHVFLIRSLPQRSRYIDISTLHEDPKLETLFTLDDLEMDVFESNQPMKESDYLIRSSSQENSTSSEVAADIKRLHSEAEKFDEVTEQLFGYVQVLTAIFASFSHGANDVANAIGPLATIFYIQENQTVTDSVPVPLILLIYGGIAMDIGLFTMGKKLMGVLGNEITFISPSRGFAAELSVSITVISAASMGIPVSTTQCICGATAGVALCNGNVKALNMKLLFKIFVGWIVTMPIAGSIAGLVYYVAYLLIN
eukprot:NODE_112_length_19362_cov_0.399678.p4 type:complete len:502 gc:universal NODE_112_length_19362_cov_0.399678:75-1580(+)